MTNGDAGSPIPRSPWLETALFLVAALLPWLALEWQEHLRWNGGEGSLWPWFTLLNMAVLASCVFLVVLPARESGVGMPIRGLMLSGSEPARLLLWGVVALVGVSLLIPISVGYLRDLSFNPACSWRADQIPFIELTLRDFWRDSRFPYYTHEIAHWHEANVYPPFLWLQYTIPYWFNTDARVWQAVCLACLCLLLFAHAGVSAAAASSPQARIGLLVPVALPFLLLFLPKWRDLLFMIHTGGVWMLCAVLALSIRTRSWVIVGVTLALCITSRAWFVFAVPPLVVYSLVHRRAMGWGLLRLWGTLCVTGLAIGGPFLLFDPGMFIQQTVKSYALFQPFKIAANPDIVQGFGVIGLLHKLRIEDLAIPLAVAGEAVLALLAAFRVRTERGVVRAVALNLLWFASFAMIPYTYIFVPAFVLLAFAGPAVTLSEQAALESLPRTTVRRLRWVFAGVFVCVLTGMTGASMFARPETLPGTSQPLAASARAYHGFDRAGWVALPMPEPLLLTESHAYLSFNTDYPRLARLLLEIEVLDPPDEAWLEVLLNGEVIGGVDLTDGERRTQAFSVPRKNLKFGGNELSLHVNGRYGGESGNVVGESGIRVWDVRATD